MKKCISLGVNNVPKYLYYLPLIKWAWAKFGWDTHIYFAGPQNTISQFVDKHISFNNYIEDLKGFKSETVAQVCRMYACYHVDYDTSLMTSDCDILPLSDYWIHDNFGIACYGRDLSNEHQPMCYVSMTAASWYEVMDLTSMDYKGEMFDRMNKNKYIKNIWSLDQHILTEMLGQWKSKKMINRGTDKRTGYPIGRVDRSNWRLDHDQLIDAHLPHDILTNDESFRKVMQLLHLVWPKEDFKWFLEYHRDFKKLL